MVVSRPCPRRPVSRWRERGWRYLGEPGQAAADIDLLVVGQPDMDALADAVTRAGARLGREVAPTVLTVREWGDGANGSVRALWDAPRVPVMGVATVGGAPAGGGSR